MNKKQPKCAVCNLFLSVGKRGTLVLGGKHFHEDCYWSSNIYRANLVQAGFIGNRE